MSLVEAVGRALADADARARRDFPEVFVRVDAILNDPDRAEPVQRGRIFDESAWARTECKWCGEDLFDYAKNEKQFCNFEHAGAYKRYLSRRKSNTNNAMRQGGRQ